MVWFQKSPTRKAPVDHSATEPDAEIPPEFPPGIIAAGTSSSSDHSYSVKESPRKLKRKLDETTDLLIDTKRKLKVQRQKVVRQRKKVEHLQTVIDSLQDENMISTNCAEVLQATFSVVPNELMQRMLNGTNNKGKAYCDELNAFAMTLQFYSTKAYNFVRETFNLALPHPRCIRSWYSGINGAPGFTKCAFDALAAQVRTDTENGCHTVCSLMLDEMHLS